MPGGAQPICFQCGQNASQRTRLNRLEDGQPCPACNERLLATLRPLLPGYDATSQAAEVDMDADLPVDVAPPLDDDRPA